MKSIVIDFFVIKWGGLYIDCLRSMLLITILSIVKQKNTPSVMYGVFFNKGVIRTYLIMNL